ncbi:MAG: hypothetical protein KKD74_02490 [Bacteroidetes bacterium]|nr:hypothetical protein [Bacteroidota bacterium]
MKLPRGLSSFMQLKPRRSASVLCAYVLFILLTISATDIAAQLNPVIADPDQHVSIPVVEIPGMDTLKPATSPTFPYTLELKNLSQYMQSTRLVFELTNATDRVLNNFWIHIALLDRGGMFLYREQPVFFSNIQPGRKGLIDILCESVGVDEVGFIVIYPGLLEENRHEIEFDPKLIQLIKPKDTEHIEMNFYNAMP